MYSNIDSKELFNIILGDIQMVIDGELDCLGKEECQPILELLEEIRNRSPHLDSRIPINRNDLEFKRGDFLEDKDGDMRGSVLFINNNHLWLFDLDKDKQVKYEAKNFNRLRKVKQ